jgi:hypothetical protein
MSNGEMSSFQESYQGAIALDSEKLTQASFKVVCLVSEEQELS